MPFRFRRPIVALVTAMLFGINVAAHGFMMTDMSVKLAAATAATSMPADHMPADHMCADCEEDGMGMGIACFAACTSTAAILSDPVQLPIFAATRDMNAAAIHLLPGRDSPPDPYPPKPFALS